MSDRTQMWEIARVELVGRQAELEQLGDWAREAAAGAPRLVLVRGEAGIGKSRLLTEFGHRLDGHFDVLRGRCYEDVTVPYLPMSTALEPLLGDWSRVATGASRDEERDERLGLYARVADALRAAVSTRPVALFVDDFHWADAASTDLLAHLVTIAALEHERFGLLVVLGHRPVVGDERVARALDRFQREDVAREIEVGALGRAEIHELVRLRAGSPPSPKLLRDLVVASGGNPLMAMWLVQRLDDFGVLRTTGGQLVNQTDSELVGLPGGLDELLRERSRAVSVNCQQLLTMAALLGDDSTVTDLAAVAGFDATSFTKLLDEATTAGLLEEVGDRYRFTHPQLRQLHYHEPAGRRRRRLHRQIADRLEAAHLEDRGYDLPIAFHLRMAGDEGDRERLVQYGVAAAQQASALGAWLDAWRLYEAVLDASAEDGDAPSAFDALVHHRAAIAAWWSHDNAATIAHERQVVRHARALGDLERWGLAVELELRAAELLAGPHMPVDLVPAEDFLAHAGDDVPDVRARVHAELAFGCGAAGRWEDARRHGAAAWSIVEDGDDADLQALVANANAGVHYELLELDEARGWYERALTLWPDDEPLLTAVGASTRLGFVLALSGDIAGASTRLARATDDAARLGAFYEQALALAGRVWCASAAGDHDEVERLAEQTELVARLGVCAAAALLWCPSLAASRVARGDHPGAHEALAGYASFGLPGTRRLHALIDAIADEPEEAVARPRAWPTPITLWELTGAAVDLDIAVRRGRGHDAGAAREGLQGAYDRGVRVSSGWPHDIRELLDRTAAASSAGPW